MVERPVPRLLAAAVYVGGRNRLTEKHMEAIGGGVLLGLGSFLAIYAYSHYDLGTFGRMGPGMFPLLCGISLLVLGFVQLLSGIQHSGQAVMQVEWRPLIFIAAACAAFALLIEQLGLVPTIAVVVAFSALANSNTRMKDAAILTVVLAILTVVVFVYLLGLRLPLAKWPW